MIGSQPPATNGITETIAKSMDELRQQINEAKGERVTPAKKLDVVMDGIYEQAGAMRLMAKKIEKVCQAVQANSDRIDKNKGRIEDNEKVVAENTRFRQSTGKWIAAVVGTFLSCAGGFIVWFGTTFLPKVQAAITGP